jgi:hypothetical protein
LTSADLRREVFWDLLRLPVSPRPVASGLQIGLQTGFLFRSLIAHLLKLQTTQDLFIPM